MPEHHMWRVNGMMSFYNIGFTHGVDDRKYITCADCEQEVLGLCFHADTETIWVAADRVKYLIPQAADASAAAAAETQPGQTD